MCTSPSVIIIYISITEGFIDKGIITVIGSSIQEKVQRRQKI